MEHCAESALPVSGPAPTWEDMQALLKIDREELMARAKAHIKGPIHAIYIGGSIAEGYGNCRSDLDIYLLIDESQRPPFKGGFAISSINGRSLQFDFVSLDQLEAAVVQLETRPFEQISMSLPTNQILHRLCHCVVIDGAETVARYASRLNGAKYLSFSSFVKQEQCENALQDAYGAWDAGQFETATFNVRLATHRAFEAVLSLRGQTATNEKWVFEKASRALGISHPALRQFKDLYRSMPADFTGAGTRDYFERSLLFMQTCFDAALSSAIVPGGAGTPLGGLGERILASNSSSAKRRNFRIHLRRAETSNMVFESGIPRRELSDRAALVWLCSRMCDDMGSAVAIAHGEKPELFEGEDLPSLAAKLDAHWLRTGMLSRAMS